MPPGPGQRQPTLTPGPSPSSTMADFSALETWPVPSHPCSTSVRARAHTHTHTHTHTPGFGSPNPQTPASPSKGASPPPTRERTYCLTSSFSNSGDTRAQTLSRSQEPSAPPSSLNPCQRGPQAPAISAGCTSSPTCTVPRVTFLGGQPRRSSPTAHKEHAPGVLVDTYGQAPPTPASPLPFS